jgi:hypothetical protein
MKCMDVVCERSAILQKLDKILTKLYGQRQTEIIFRITNSLEKR